MPRPLANTTYRRLFAAQVIALFGTGLTTVALGLLAYELAAGEAGVVLGTALALKVVAYVMIAPAAGAFAHRLPRRATLVTLDLARAAVVLLMPFVTEVWHVYGLILVLNAGSAAFTPIFQATIPDVIRDEATYTRALSLSRLAYDLEKLLSPAAAAVALLLLSYDGLFAANAVAFVISAFLVSSVMLPRAATPEREGGIAESLGFGLSIYLRTPRLRGLLALSMAVAAGGAMVIVNTVVVVRDRFGGTEAETAVALAAAGCGSMIAAILLPRLLDSLADRPVMLIGGLTLGGGLLLGPLIPDLTWMLAVWLVLGVGSSIVQTPAGRLLRRSAREGDRSVVFAAQFALSHACWLVTYPLAGLAGAALGMEATYLLLALICLGSTALALNLWPAGDPVVLEHTHAAREHQHLHVHDEHHQHEHEGWEGPEPHRHPHAHGSMRHRHAFVIDLHHPEWPSPAAR